MSNPGRSTKNHLYAQVARIGAAIASPKRLELIEILCHGEKTVEQLASDAEMSVKLASAHLKALRIAHLLQTRRDGKYVFYRLASHAVSDFWVALRALAEDRLVELQLALSNLAEHADELAPVAHEVLLSQAAKGEIVVIDVRPHSEYANAHLPYAVSLPLAELRTRMSELPSDKPVVAYCRGPFCLWGKEAVTLLREFGYAATRLQDGVSEWRAQGRKIATGVQHVL